MGGGAGRGCQFLIELKGGNIGSSSNNSLLIVEGNMLACVMRLGVDDLIKLSATLKTW